MSKHPWLWGYAVKKLKTDPFTRRAVGGYQFCFEEQAPECGADFCLAAIPYGTWLNECDDDDIILWSTADQTVSDYESFAHAEISDEHKAMILAAGDTPLFLVRDGQTVAHHPNLCGYLELHKFIEHIINNRNDYPDDHSVRIFTGDLAKETSVAVLRLGDLRRMLSRKPAISTERLAELTKKYNPDEPIPMVEGRDGGDYVCGFFAEDAVDVIRELLAALGCNR